MLVSNCDAIRYVLATLEHKNLHKALALEETDPEEDFKQSLYGGRIVATPEDEVGYSHGQFPRLDSNLYQRVKDDPYHF